MLVPLNFQYVSINDFKVSLEFLAKELSSSSVACLNVLDFFVLFINLLLLSKEAALTVVAGEAVFVVTKSITVDS